jgi:hypothetical protein
MTDKTYAAFVNDYVIGGSRRIDSNGQTVWHATAYSASFARDYGLNYVVQVTVTEKVDESRRTLQLNEEGARTALTDAVLQAVQEWIDEPPSEE